MAINSAKQVAPLGKYPHRRLYGHDGSDANRTKVKNARNSFANTRPIPMAEDAGE